MKTMIYLLRREFWEHKGMFLWTPLASASAMLLVFVLPVIFGKTLLKERHFARIASMRDHTALVGDVLARVYMMFTGPILAVMAFIIFFYCLGCLYDDRRDRSILFWKSLPVSDVETVLSKLLTACVVVPVIFLLIGTAMSFIMMVIVSIGLATQDVYLFKDLLLNKTLYLSPLQVFGMLPVYVLWALPSLGWLLLVSSWARSKVFLWAIGVPLMSLLLLTMAQTIQFQSLDVSWFADLIVGRGLGGIVPGSWVHFEHIPYETAFRPGTNGVDFGAVLSISWNTLSSPQIWWGVLAATLMFYMTIRLRRWREAE
ncbi:hypothetical protein ACO0LD_27645 [Undibacterium sp. Ji83W]|uniref:hypothetical protein n=1 Tax=Undibacterium sp. Ji83W TaxID=3413043 RepID=UPI003BF40C49